MADLIYVVVAIIGCLAIISYATWLLFERLKSKDQPARSFGEWLKNVFEAIIGL